MDLRSDQASTLRLLAASYGHLGRIEEARAALDGMYRLMPHFSVDTFRLIFPPAIVERYIDGWRKAGWKE